MLNLKENQVYTSIQTKGPLLPIEIARSLSMETYIVSAILATLLKNKKIEISKRKIGSSNLYYIPGQEGLVRKRLLPELNALEQKALQRVKELKVAFENELYPQERFMLKEMLDFVNLLKVKTEKEEFDVWVDAELTKEEINEIIKKRLENLKEKSTPIEKPKEALPEKNIPIEKEETKQELLSQEPPKELPEKKERKRKSTQNTNFNEKLNDYLKRMDITLIKVLSIKANENIAIVSIPSIIGDQFFYMFYTTKKNLNEGDLSKIYLEASKHKMPILLILENEINSKINQYIKDNFGNLIKIIKMK